MSIDLERAEDGDTHAATVDRAITTVKPADTGLLPPRPRADTTAAEKFSGHGVQDDRATRSQEAQLMTTLTAQPTSQSHRPHVLTAVVSGLAGIAVGATIAVAVPRLSQPSAGSTATTLSRQAVTVQGGGTSLYGGTLTEQVPHAAVVWLRSRASSYEPGGSTYTQQVPYAARHGSTNTWASQGSTYRQQVPEFN